ncbi:MAG: MFS transporter [Rhodothermales bacterium]
MKLGLRENAGQFTLLVVVNAFVGAMVGLERAVLPLLAEDEFGLASRTAVLSFIASFGLAKALANLMAGRWSDRFGRKRVLVWGWLIGLPVPLLIMWAPTWTWIVFANVLLGMNQGLAWSATVIMKIDLVGPKQRGLAMGLNEAAGYVAVSAAAFASGYIASTWGLRPEPFFLGLVIAVFGLLLSLFFVRDTLAHAQLEARAAEHAAPSPEDASFSRILLLTSWKNRTLFGVSQAGMVNNLNDGLAWGLFPLYYASLGLSVAQIGFLAALYPAVWGFGQLLTGAWSDRVGRRPLIVGGMLLQALGIFILAAGTDIRVLAASMVLLGAGTAAVYPTLLATIGDVAHPTWRATSVGVYRLWRDGGYVVGALLAGVLADLFSLMTAMMAIAALTALSGVVARISMTETRKIGV